MGKLSKFLTSSSDPRAHPLWSKWIRAVPGESNKAYCLLCVKSFCLSSMGATAVKSHAKSASHLKAIQSKSLQLSVAEVFPPSTSQSSSSPLSIDGTEYDGNHVSLDSAITSPFSMAESLKRQESVVRAEIIWCLKLISSHFSFRSCKSLSATFAAMFPDSGIAAQFGLGRDKVAYTITYGLGPFFYDQLKSRLMKCDDISVCFDEALNRISQRGQMDLLVCFWDDSKSDKQVTTRYLYSSFLGRARASDLADAFKSGLSGVPTVKVVQISMDGPAVNHKFYREIKAELITSADTPGLLDTGSCGLHVVSGAFQAGHKATGWNINGFLRNIYWLLKDSPARRSSFITATETSVFPLKFCTVRWVENAKVADRAIHILPSLKKWVTIVEPKPSGQVFEQVKAMLNDPVLCARLHLFKFIALLLEPFLTQFQSPAPLFPVLFEKLEQLVRSLMVHFVKADILAGATTVHKLMQISLDGDNLKPKPDIGFGSSKALANPKVTQLVSWVLFRLPEIFVKVTEKIVERSPLKYRIVRGASALSPLVIKSGNKYCESRFLTLLDELVSNNRLSTDAADQAKLQYGDFLSNSAIKQEIDKFSLRDCRLDQFYTKCLSLLEGMDHLFMVVQKILILSHGNSAVESGFSVNEDFLCENLHENSDRPTTCIRRYSGRG